MQISTASTVFSLSTIINVTSGWLFCGLNMSQPTVTDNHTYLVNKTFLPHVCLHSVGYDPKKRLLSGWSRFVKSFRWSRGVFICGSRIKPLCCRPRINVRYKLKYAQKIPFGPEHHTLSHNVVRSLAISHAEGKDAEFGIGEEGLGGSRDGGGICRLMHCSSGMDGKVKISSRYLKSKRKVLVNEISSV